MSEWKIKISSKMCPFRKLGGLNDNSASGTFYTACILSKHKDEECYIFKCPIRIK